MEANCIGTHRFYVAETGVVEAEGKVVVIMVCNSCGEAKLHEFKVAGKVQLVDKKKKET